MYSLANFCEDCELIGSTLRPLEDVARLVADEPNGCPALEIVVLGDQSSAGVAATRPPIRDSAGADLRVGDHTVLDSDRPNVHLADLRYNS